MKKVVIGLLGLIAVGLVWYLFIKPSDYIVNFEAKANVGTINQSIKTWSERLENSKIIDQNGLSEIKQQLTFADSTHLYRWKITPIHDSLSKIRVYIKDVDHSLANKIQVPFADTVLEKRSKQSLTDFNKELIDHLKTIRISIEGRAENPTSFCACTELSGLQYEKATGMMKDYPLLSSILVNNGVKLNGPPILEVTSWNMDKDYIEYRFCFPIIRSERLPEHPEIKYKRLFSKKSIKAVYNGNYITSDRAWYALLDYAKNNNLNVTGLPIEVFHNNPNFGGNELNWKAEIYMPIDEKPIN